MDSPICSRVVSWLWFQDHGTQVEGGTSGNGRSAASVGKGADGVLSYLWINARVLKICKAAGVASKSFTSVLLDDPSLTEEDEHAIKWTASTLYGGKFPLRLLFTIHLPYLLGGADTVRMSVRSNGSICSCSTRPLRPYMHSSWP